MGFKKVGETFLTPVIAVVYAILATMIMWSILRFEDAFHDGVDHVSDALKFCFSSVWGEVCLHWFDRCRSLFPQSTKLAMSFQAKRTLAMKHLRMFFVSLGLAGILRLAVRYFGLRYLPRLWSRLAPNANPWQLAFEPMVFFYISGLVKWAESKMDKLMPITKPPPIAPVTFLRERPMEDWTELFRYRWGRLTRNFNFYKKQAEAIVKMIVDDLFNTVVLVRVTCIVLPSLRGFVRMAFKLVGAGMVLERHATSFYESTDFVPGADAAYFTDRLLQFSYGLGVSKIGEVGSSVSNVAVAWQALWRLVVPIALYCGYRMWKKLLEEQRSKFNSRWVGDSWRNGDYERVLEKYGTFWNSVDISCWDPVPPALPTDTPDLFSEIRRRESIQRRNTITIQNLARPILGRR